MNIKTAEILIYNSYENVFVVDAPNDRDFILVSSSGGYGQNGIGDTCLSNPTIQIMVANTDYQTCKTITGNIKKYLMNIDRNEINTILEILADNPEWDELVSWDTFDVWNKYTCDKDKLVGYSLQSDEIELGRDKQLRYRVSINFMLWQNNK
jgi:hypothetical protein